MPAKKFSDLSPKQLQALELGIFGTRHLSGAGTYTAGAGNYTADEVWMELTCITNSTFGAGCVVSDGDIPDAGVTYPAGHKIPGFFEAIQVVTGDVQVVRVPANTIVKT